MTFDAEKIKEVNLIKFAFAEAIEAKQQYIKKIIDNNKLYDRLGFVFSNGKARNYQTNPEGLEGAIERIKEEIQFLLECYDKAEDMRIKMSDQRVASFAKQYKKGRG